MNRNNIVRKAFGFSSVREMEQQKAPDTTKANAPPTQYRWVAKVDDFPTIQEKELCRTLPLFPKLLGTSTAAMTQQT